MQHSSKNGLNINAILKQLWLKEITTLKMWSIVLV